MLKFRIVRHAQGPAQFKRHPKRAGRFDILGMQSHQRNLSRGDAFLLKIMGQPANGARAFRSYRHQKQYVDAVLL